MIRVGIGGWVFEPWRGEFYPKGLPQVRELEHASRKLTSIEINSTFYRTQKPDSFRKWAAETPDDFVFSLKGPQFATNRRVQLSAPRWWPDHPARHPRPSCAHAWPTDRARAADSRPSPFPRCAASGHRRNPR